MMPQPSALGIAIPSPDDRTNVENRLPELRELVGQLDRLVPREGAKLRIPNDPDGNTTIGTQRGYLRLGIEFLRAGLAPTAGSDREVPRIPLDVEYLLTQDSDAPFDRCEVHDDVERLPPRARKLGPLGQLLAALVAVAVVGLILMGAAAALAWMFH
jgi:hypothetical protein